MPKFAPPRLVLSIWGLAVAFYLYGFFQRVAPASLADDLTRDFHLTATSLGNLSAFYFYAYAAMQLPTGVLVDRFGPARVLFFGALAAGVGTMLFATAPTATLAAIGRGLIGGAHAVAWVSMLQLITHWFPLRNFGTLSGLSLGIGTLGAVLAGPPLRWLSDAYGWRWVLAAIGTLALALALAIRKFVRNDPRDCGFTGRVPPRINSDARQREPVWRGLLDIWKSRNTMLLFLVNSGIGGSFLTFTALWGVPFFTQLHALSVRQASLITSTMLVLFAIGGPVIGTWSDKVHRRKMPYLVGALLLTVSFCALALSPRAPLALLIPLLLAGAFGAGAMALSFGFAKESVPAHLQGTVTGAVNMGVISGTLIQMPLIGLVLDHHWSGELVNGVRQYGLSAFRPAWIFLAGWTGLSTLLLMFTRDTHAAQSREVPNL